MQEVVVQEWCDVCFKANQRNEPTFKDTVSVAGLSRRLDLCGKHEKEIVGALREVLEEFGQPLPEVSRPKGVGAQESTGLERPETCPRCGKRYTNVSGVMGHSRREHAERPFNMAEMQILYPDKAMMACPAEGCKVVGTVGPGITAHMRSVHGIIA